MHISKPTSNDFIISVTAEEFQQNGINLIAFGCDGTGDLSQIKLGGGVNLYGQELATRKTAAIVFRLGDIKYGRRGIEKKDDPSLDTHVYGPFGKDGLPQILALGNHELGVAQVEKLKEMIVKGAGWLKNYAAQSMSYLFGF